LFFVLSAIPIAFFIVFFWRWGNEQGFSGREIIATRGDATKTKQKNQPATLAKGTNGLNRRKIERERKGVRSVSICN